jgi:hypothetical protein
MAAEIQEQSGMDNLSVSDAELSANEPGATPEPKAGHEEVTGDGELEATQDLGAEDEQGDFFDNDDGEPTPDAEAGLDSDDIEPYKFQSDGKEVELHPIKDAEEIKRRLGMYEGGKRAFSEAARYKKSDREKERRIEALEKKVEIVDRLEQYRDDPESAFEIFTGKSLDELVEAKARRMVKYAEADEGERKTMDAEDANARTKREMEKLQRETERSAKEAKDREERTRQIELQTLGKPHFFAVLKKLGIKDPAERQEAGDILWNRAFDRVYDRVKHPSEITESMIKKELIAVGKVMGLTRTRQTRAQVDQEVKNRKETARKKAGVAAARNYRKPNADAKYENMNPQEAFYAMKKDGRFKRR